MRMYLHAKYPIQFFIPAHGLMLSIQKLQAAGLGTVEQTLAGMRDWFMTMFRPHNPDQKVKLLPCAADSAGMPTCVLGLKTGIYSVETGSGAAHFPGAKPSGGVPFAGTRLNGDLLGSYRQKLGQLDKLMDPDLFIELKPSMTEEVFNNAILEGLGNYLTQL
jgi:hypothetical protein